jgi:hypothetical protein
MSEYSEDNVKEVDRLRYKGNNVPLFIKIAWVAIFLFTFIYTVLYAWPDLKLWISP